MSKKINKDLKVGKKEIVRFIKMGKPKKRDNKSFIL